MLLEISKKSLGEKDLQTEVCLMQQSFVSQLAVVKWRLRGDEMRLGSWEKGVYLA